MALRAVTEHPKFYDLKARLGCGRGEALGYLEAMWHFCGRYSPRGNIGKYTDQQIEAWIEWSGDTGLLVQSMVQAGWIDEHAEYRLVVHHWSFHADKATKQALRRAKEDFVCTACPESGTVFPETSTVLHPNAISWGLTGQGQGQGQVSGAVKSTMYESEIRTAPTEQNELELLLTENPPDAEIPSEGFERWYSEFWTHKQRAPAEMKAWPRAVKKIMARKHVTASEAEAYLMACLEMQKTFIEQNPEQFDYGLKAMLPASWLNGERWADEMTVDVASEEIDWSRV